MAVVASLFFCSCQLFNAMLLGICSLPSGYRLLLVGFACSSDCVLWCCVFVPSVDYGFIDFSCLVGLSQSFANLKPLEV